MTPDNVSLPLRSEFTALLFLGLVWTILSVIVNPVGEVPLNDDWVYALAVRSVLETGNFVLPAPSSANVIAQIYWGALFCLPFGFSFMALRVSTLVLGGMGIIALYLLLRELGAHRQLAVLGAMTMAVNPFYFGLSPTFMSDVPFTAAITASLWLYVRGARRDDMVTLGGAVLLAYVAILIRQFALVLPLAFGIAHIVRKGVGTRALAVAILPFVLGIVLHIAYQGWLVATGRMPLIPVPLDRLVPLSALPFLRYAVRVIFAFIPYLGLCVAPFAAYLVLVRQSSASATTWIPPWHSRLSVVLSVILMAALIKSRNILPAFGNTLIPSGFGPLTVHDAYLLHLNQPQISGIATGIWAAVTALSAWAVVEVALAIAYTLVRLGRNMPRADWQREAWPPALMLTMTASYATGLILIGDHSSIFDRYLLPLLPAFLAILLMEPGYSWPVPQWSKRMLPSLLLLALYAAFSVTATHDYLAWNRARWQATDSLLQAGVTPNRIDGGYEFNGWHLYSPTYREKPGKSYWWVDDDEYIIAAGPLKGYEETARFDFSRWLRLGESSVLILHRIAAHSDGEGGT